MTGQARLPGEDIDAAASPLDDPEWLARARSYRRDRLRWLLADLAFDVAAGGLALALRLPVIVQERLARRLPAGLPAEACTIASYGAGAWLLGLPSRAWRDLVLEHRYDLSTQRGRDWIVDQLKALALGLPVETLIGQGVLAALRRWPRRWWLALSLAAAPLAALFSFLFPVVIAPRFNRYRPLEDEALAARLRDQAAAAGIQVSEILVTDLSRRTRKANAFFAGLGRTRRIVLGDTLLDEFAPDEIAVILAHELGHQAHRDLWRLILASTAQVTLTTWLAQRLAERATRRYGRQLGLGRLDQPAALPLIAWLAALAGLILAPAVSAFSRRIERQADRFALELTGDASAFIRAMQRLAVQNLSDPDPPRLERWLFGSHPSIAERVAAARQFARQRHTP
ncbi:M48 family metallopeptidase [Thermomicrobiaceae bacterium CFH 74404]|uniref:M48 family metallopeptidase n=1 Tax=Thermalbibacter longus TaxID=2951981 RepID=A0AA41WAS2_9BACT|nr:M48 family metallopeptidase [Thermalbibacter longus]MCM8749419.1 M48 family metallopeptidase [Thermalbibacter longus]